MKLAVHLHIFYLEQLDYLIKKLASLDGFPFDLFVTLTVEDEDVNRKILAFKPDARIWVVENRGYDVGPFIDFLNQIVLDDYDYILKLHTKGISWVKNTEMNHFVMSNSDWRRLLVDALLENPQRVLANLHLLSSDEMISLIGSASCRCSRPLHYQKLLPGINQLMLRIGLAPISQCEFIGGTMFMARAHIFKPLQNKLQLVDFEPTNGLVKEGLLAHVMERVFGALATQNSQRIQGVGSEGWFVAKSLINAIIRLFYQNKKTNSKHIIKILKLPIYYKRMPSC